MRALQRLAILRLTPRLSRPSWPNEDKDDLLDLGAGRALGVALQDTLLNCYDVYMPFGGMEGLPEKFAGQGMMKRNPFLSEHQKMVIRPRRL